MIYTTLKKNHENNMDDFEIADYCDMSFYHVGRIFGEQYEDGYDYTNFGKLYDDYSPRQVASKVLQYLREQAKSKDNFLLNYAPLKVFIELDGEGQIAYDQLVDLIENGEITGSAVLKDIEKKAKKKGRTIKKGVRYGENDIYFKYLYIDDIIDKYFPCQEELRVDEDGDEYLACTQCGNCH